MVLRDAGEASETGVFGCICSILEQQARDFGLLQGSIKDESEGVSVIGPVWVLIQRNMFPTASKALGTNRVISEIPALQRKNVNDYYLTGRPKSR